MAASPTRLSRAVTRFLATESAGGAVLLAGALVALVAANSPWQIGWEALWTTDIDVRAGSWELRHDLRAWINDGLMAIFFFVVGLEIKRELVVGELRDPRRAAVPALAAIGGMVVPAVLFLAVAQGQGTRGWGIPMATDIAFAVGVVALLGSRVPASLKLYLLTLAIVDDIGAIVVIAAFYSSGIDLTPLAAAAGLLGVVILLKAMGVRALPPYVVLGILAWLAMLESGVHPTIAGVLLGMLTPARPQTPAALASEWSADLEDEPTTEELRSLVTLARAGVSVAERLQHVLHPWTSFAVVPLFALANAGVRIDLDSLAAPGSGRVAGAVVVGLVAGKLVGVLGATWLAVRLGIGTLPPGAAWSQVAGVAAIAGIGFTVSIFVAGLAFESPALEAAAKLGILVGSAAAAAIGVGILLRADRDAASPAAGGPSPLGEYPARRGSSDGPG